MRKRPRPRARRTSSSSSRSSLKMSCWNSYDVISTADVDVGDEAYKRQRELHGGLRITGHWIGSCSDGRGGARWRFGMGARSQFPEVAKLAPCHEIGTQGWTWVPVS
jgi:hypothetical protein